jgi:hypothetical protein
VVFLNGKTTFCEKYDNVIHLDSMGDPCMDSTRKTFNPIIIGNYIPVYPK